MYIYKIENKITGKCYIGQTSKCPKKRWKEHKCSANSGDNRRLYQSMRKHGIDNFEFSIICETKNIEFLDDLEIKVIEQENSFKNGYNMTEGGKAFSSRNRPNTWSHKAVETRRANNKSFASRTVKFLVEKEGITVEGENLTKFCKENSLSIGNLWETFYGRRKQHKGYKLIRTFND